MKTPEQMAEEYCEEHDECEFAGDAFLAGYRAAKDEDKAKVQELEANWKFCCEDKVRLLNELAAAERAKDQFADADKVMNSPEKLDSCDHILDMEKMVDVNSSNNSNSWISVKERLPESISDVLVLTKEKESYVGYYRSSDNDWNMYNPCCSFHMELHGVTHWMPLPEAPKEEG